jgi:hypothetical protein
VCDCHSDFDSGAQCPEILDRDSKMLWAGEHAIASVKSSVLAVTVIYAMCDWILGWFEGNDTKEDTSMTTSQRM